MRRLLAACGVAASLAAAALACTIAYSSYDDRFQPVEDGGLAAFVIDDAAIQAVAVTASDLFYATSRGIERAPLDGAAPSTWLTASGVEKLATDGTGTIAWATSTDNEIHQAYVASPGSAAVVSTTRLGQFSKLASDAAHFAWASVPPANCPCELGEVRGWQGVSAQAVDYDGGVKTFAQDVAVDGQGVTFFAPSLGFRRFAFDGTFVCGRPAGVGDQGAPGALHAIASGPDGTPFFAIAPTSGAAGPLLRYETACDDAGTEIDPNASAVMADETNLFWITSGGALETAGLDGGAGRIVPLSGAAAAMTSDAAFVYVAVGDRIFRIAKTP
ncbi:MAG TPA: hypothetical protein VGH28_07770 [Polyangiaceae bacterium]|jgi:hypothetical protein